MKSRKAQIRISAGMEYWNAKEGIYYSRGRLAFVRAIPQSPVERKVGQLGRDHDIHPFQRLRWKNIFGANPCRHLITLG
jgi:hypothetical protein